MKLAIHGDDRLGLIVPGGLIDATDLIGDHDSGLGAGYWVRLCRDFARIRPGLEERQRRGAVIPLDAVDLRAPALNPTKIIAAAANYGAHVEEMATSTAPSWMLDFDVFLKAPSSIAAPGARIRLPEVDGEIHYECELALVVGRGGHNIAPEDALAHVLGWTVLFDITERGSGDRSRRKSYDGFTPMGPWLTTADEVQDWRDLQIELRLNGDLRQSTRAGEMLVGVPEMIAYASRVMTLNPGDVITTGAPPGVGAVRPGDRLEGRIDGVGRLEVSFA